MCEKCEGLRDPGIELSIDMSINLTCEGGFSNQWSIMRQHRLSCITKYHTMLAKKYFALWKLFIKYNKKKKSLLDKEKLFEEKISTFIINLKNKTLKVSVFEDVNDESKSNFSKKTKKDFYGAVYENRFKAQKEMIENQKAIIAEQNGIIDKLRCVSPIEIDLEEENFQIMVNNSGKSSEKIKSLPKPFEHPLVKRMKEREEDRKNRRSLLTMRRIEKEKYLAEQLIREEEERKRLAVENRKIRIRERKEKERILKEMEIAKMRDHEFRNELRDRAKSLYQKLLCAKIFRRWKGRMEWLHTLKTLFTYQYEKSLLKRTMSNWKDYTLMIQNKLQNIVSWMEERYTLTIVWNCWKLKIHQINKQRELIKIWIDMESLRHLLRKWLNYTHKSITKNASLLKCSVIFYERILIIKSFHTWKKLPQILYHEREKEKRLREWERKVKSILPDYNADRTVSLY